MERETHGPMIKLYHERESQFIQLCILETCPPPQSNNKHCPLLESISVMLCYKQLKDNRGEILLVFVDPFWLG